MRYLFLLLCGLCLCVSNAKASLGVLSNADIKNYKQIFALQHKGDFVSAKTIEKKIQNKLLLGYVLFDRYFSKKYVTKPKEIETEQ